MFSMFLSIKVTSIKEMKKAVFKRTEKQINITYIFHSLIILNIFFSMSSLLLSIFPFVYLVCCNAMPNFPCCPGSQKVVAVMSKYIDTFSAAADESTVCSTAKSTVDGIKSELCSRGGCPSGGEAQIVNEIDRQLKNFAKMEINYEDKCPYNLGFARAMFDLAAAAAGHAGNGTEWQYMKVQFEQESKAIKAIGQELNIEVTDVHFGVPSKGVSAHQNVPSPSHVIANPGQHSSVGQGKDDEPLSSDFDF